MKKAILLLICVYFVAATAKSQDEEDNSLQISGSVDTYWKYDFSGESQIPTSFASEQNSVSIGMLDLALSQTVGKASFVGEIAFGPRGQYESTPNSDVDGNSFHIQNLYVSYALSDKLSLTAGYMGTFVGYEVISPAANFNYSTSYLFSFGPFQNAGIKADYAFSDKVALMVGLFNDWNVYQDGGDGITDFGAQLYLAPTEGWDIYLNFISGDPSGTEIDLTTGYQVSDAFYLGLNAADYSAPDDAGGFTGFALYPQYSVSDAVALGLRGEYFATKDIDGGADGQNITAITVTGNLKAGPLTVIPEIRFDNGSEEVFVDGDGAPTKSASQFLIAAVYAF